LPADVREVAKQSDVVVYAVTLAPEQPHPRALARSAPDLLAGRTVIAVPTPREAPPTFLDEITSLTGGRLFSTADPRGLQELFARAVREMKTRYVLSYTPQGVTAKGWHALDVRLTVRSGDITARRGYFVP
jgi:VWFA-related protein